MIKFCKKCQDEKRNFCPSGYYFGWKENVKICPNCGGEFVDIDFPPRDLAIILKISQDKSFVEAMINLRNDNVIEYESRMIQFKNQTQQIEQQENSAPKCPVCGSIELRKITTPSKVMSTAMFGLLGTKRHKTFHCNNCGYEF